MIPVLYKPNNIYSAYHNHKRKFDLSGHSSNFMKLADEEEMASLSSFCSCSMMKE